MSTHSKMIHTMELTQSEDIDPSIQQEAVNALENGFVLYFPSFPFSLKYEEKQFLTPNALRGRSKNICYSKNTNIVKGSAYRSQESQQLAEMMSRFANFSESLVLSLIPYYRSHLIHGRTSYRPIEIMGRKTSIKKDDTRLHIDAFPATPNQGKRILRVFSNINPEGKARVWNLGEPFEVVANKFSHVFKKPIFGSRALLALLKITKSYRSLYDHYMLQLHDAMKMDEAYQRNVNKETIHFPAGATWIVMTDSASHAALSGQYLLEHTFYLPSAKMRDPSLSPQHILRSKIVS